MCLPRSVPLTVKHSWIQEEAGDEGKDASKIEEADDH